MSQITSIEQQKKDKTRCSVYIDGAFYCGLKIEIAVKYRLKAGMAIDRSELDAIQLAEEKLTASVKAMNHLSATIKTRANMVDFLKSKGYTQGVIDYVIAKLESYGYIDDFAYCRSYVNSVSGKGRNALRAALIKRGAAREAIDAALDEVEEDEDEVLAVARKYMRGKTADKISLQKCLRHLVSRGYGFDTAKSAVEKLCGEEDVYGED